MWNDRQQAQCESEGEHGQGVDVDDARLVAPVVGQHLREEADGGEQRSNS